MAFEIVDCHTHVVAADHLAYPLEPRALSASTWVRDGARTAEQLLEAMDGAGVGRAVLVQGVGAYSYDNRYVADMAARWPARFVGAGCIDVEAADALARLDHWIGERGLQGIRLFALAREGPSWLAEERTLPVWERATAFGAHVIVTILPHQLDELARVLARFPAIPVSLDHCAFATDDPAHLDALLALARYGNLHLKLTTHALDAEVAARRDPRVLVGALVEAFGAERLMWGSDFCQIFDRPYGDLVDLAREAFGGLDAAARAACLGDTARRLWPGLRPEAS